MNDQYVLSRPTGTPSPPATRTLVFPFDQFEVVVRVSDSGQAVGVEEIRIRKDFRKPSQIGSVDVDQFYQE